MDPYFVYWISDVLNKDLENGCNDHMLFKDEKSGQTFLNPENKDVAIFDLKDKQELRSFKIQGEKCGPPIFNRMKSPIAADAIIGMDFIDSMLMFIDFVSRKIHFYAYPLEDEACVNSVLVELPL